MESTKRTIRIHIELYDDTGYGHERVLRVDATEMVPRNKRPIKFLRKRVIRELDRQVEAAGGVKAIDSIESEERAEAKAKEARLAAVAA